MASAGEDAVGEAESAGNSVTKKSRRRVFDYLGDSDGGEAELAPSACPPETPPQLRLPRFTCATFRFARLGRKRGARKDKDAVAGAKHKTEAASSVDSSLAAGSKPAETSTSSSSASAEASGGGVGPSMLLLLLARTCVELNRMAEVRAQMETLLKEIRDEAGRVKVAVTPPRTFSLRLSSSSGCTTDTDANRHHRAAEGTMIPRPRECGESERFSGDGEQVELELETVAELDARHGPRIECNDDDGQENSDELSEDDEFIELDGGRFRCGDRKGWEWDASGDEDSEEEHSTAGAQDVVGGVCAVELERRLHEVLHRRHRERIEELESALRRAEQKLREKEMEARLWQDTANLALQPPRDGPS